MNRAGTKNARPDFTPLKNACGTRPPRIPKDRRSLGPDTRSWMQAIIYERVYSVGKNFTGKINPDVILPVKLKFYRQNKSRSYSAGKT